MNFRPIAFAGVGCGLAAVFVLFGGRSLARSSLEQAAHFVEHCSKERHLRGHGDAFLRLESGRDPSDWVKYFLSIYASGSWMTQRELDEMGVPSNAPRSCPLVPEDVVIISGNDPSNSRRVPESKPRKRYRKNLRLQARGRTDGKVLVVFPDDDRRKIRVVAYEDWEVDFEREWDFPLLPSNMGDSAGQRMGPHGPGGW